jgi:hypothetical protein
LQTQKEFYGETKIGCWAEQGKMTSETLWKTMERNQIGPSLFAWRFLADPFVLEAAPFVGRLTNEQRSEVLKALEAAPKIRPDYIRRYRRTVRNRMGSCN